jgi:adenylate cyclase
VNPSEAALLVVDDIEDNRYTLTRRLSREGYTNLTTAANGREALELLQEKPIDLVLLDIMMPEMNGYEVLERLKADPDLRHIPIIMISAVDEIESVIRCIELGAEDYLSKPFNPTLLRARVGASLERKRLHDQVRAQAADLATWNKTLEKRVADQLAEIERMGRLRRFLSPQIAAAVLASGDESVLESHRRDIAVVFCDVRGFTAFAETAEPEEVTSFLREYHTRLGALIHKYEGTLERFIGDGLMVLFNDPLRCTDPSIRAVRMAVEMRTQIKELTAKWRKQGHELGFGMGISYGYATLGRIGFEGRFDYSAVGTVVNLAARLCEQASDGQILIDGKVLSAIEAVAETQPAGELTLKGLHRPIPAFNVCGLVSAGAEAMDQPVFEIPRSR